VTNTNSLIEGKTFYIIFSSGCESTRNQPLEETT